MKGREACLGAAESKGPGSEVLMRQPGLRPREAIGLIAAAGMELSKGTRTKATEKSFACKRGHDKCCSCRKFGADDEIEDLGIVD